MSRDSGPAPRDGIGLLGGLVLHFDLFRHFLFYWFVLIFVLKSFVFSFSKEEHKVV